MMEKILNFNPRTERLVPRMEHEHTVVHSDFTGDDRCAGCDLTPAQIEEMEKAAAFNSLLEKSNG